MSGSLRLRQLNVGNLSASNSAITATTTDSDITLTANGTGEVKIGNTTASTSTSVVTKGYADSNSVTPTGSQTLTNKTITDATNTVRATQIQSVIVSGTAPATGQFLVATGATNADWRNVVDSNTIFADDVTASKRMQFQLSGIAAATTRTLTVPDDTGVLVLDTNVQVITNKDITDHTNSCLASVLKTGTDNATDVQLSLGNPVARMVLMASSTTSAGWSSTYYDNAFTVANVTDTTKKFIFDCSSITAGNTRTLTVPDSNGTIALTSDITASVLVSGISLKVNTGQTTSAYTPSADDTLSPGLSFINNVSDLQYILPGATSSQVNDSGGVGTHDVATITNFIESTTTTTEFVSLTNASTYRLNATFTNLFKVLKLSIYFTSTSVGTTLVSVMGFTSAQSSPSLPPMSGGAPILTNYAIVDSTANTLVDVPITNLSTAYLYFGVSLERITSDVPQGIARINFYDYADNQQTPLYLGTNYTRSVDSSTGHPAYSLIQPTVKTVTYNLVKLAIPELYARVYPIMIAPNRIHLTGTTGGSNPPSQIYLNSDDTKIWSIYAGNTTFNIADETDPRTNRLVLSTTRVDFNTTIGIMTNTSVSLNHVLRCTATGTPNIFTPSFVNLQELADYDATITKTNNDILTYNTTTSKWEPRDYVMLGTNNSIRLEENALDTFKLSSVNATYGATFSFSNTVWTQSFNNGKVSITGNNTNSTFGNSYTVRIDNDTDALTLQGGASSNLVTGALNYYSTNQKWSKASNHYNTGVITPTSGAYAIGVNDAIVIRDSGTGSQDCTLPYSTNIFVGWHVKIIMTTGTSGTISPNSSDTGGTINDSTSFNQTSAIHRTYTYLGFIGGVASWWYDN